MQQTIVDRRLLGTAAAHATRHIPVAAPDDEVDTVLRDMRGRRFDSAAVIAVCDGDRLAGLATVERVLAAPPGATVREVMDPDPPVVTPHSDQERAAWLAVRHHEPGLAVVGSDGEFHGLIAPHRLLGILLEEHDEDLARIGGYLRSTASARLASEESVPRRLWHRLPWLLLGLVGALLSAFVVGAFEGHLQAQVLLAFFLPGVVYLAAAIGQQTQTLVIRGLSVGVPIRRVAVREALTGLGVGTVLALVMLPVNLLLWGNTPLAVAVSLAVFGAGTIATCVAMALPWLLNRLGLDPAFGSGPVSTVIQDLLSILIYFATAVLVVF